jgi:hypothetical protein
MAIAVHVLRAPAARRAPAPRPALSEGC